MKTTRNARCCMNCKHCEIHILRGTECTANQNLFPIPLAGEDLYKNRSNCKAYVRG